MPTITINTEAPGTPTKDKPSDFGHVWFSASNGIDPPIISGFGPEASGDPFGPGKPNPHGPDSDYYQGESWSSITINITNEGYEALKQLHQDPAKFGFDMNYNGLNNSCVDYVFKALEVSGLNPFGYDGHILPRDNLLDILKIKFMQEMGAKISGQITDMNDALYDAFLAAKRWMPRVDPLTLDLDGDGIETVAASASNPILFDHDGDGIKNGTGWVKGDDGFLVLDRNSNGVINNGAELFGDSTPLRKAA